MYVSRCVSRIALSVTTARGFLLTDGWPRRPRKAQGFWPRSRLDSTSKRNDSSRPDLLLEQTVLVRASSSLESSAFHRSLILSRLPARIRSRTYSVAQADPI